MTFRTPTMADSTDGTFNKGVLLGENTEETTVTDAPTGNVTFKAYKYSSDFVKVSVELLQDSAFDLSAIMGQILGERIGRITNEHFTTGDNSSKPQGIVTAAGTGAAFTTGITTAALLVADTDGSETDKFYDVVHACDIAYRGNAAWMMHDNSVLTVRKLKDSSGNYVWTDNRDRTFAAGVAGTLCGYPIVVNNDMDGSLAGPMMSWRSSAR